MNYKRILTISMLVASVNMLQAQSFESATDAVKNMGVGWNLGNTLEANNQDKAKLDPTKASFWGQQELDSENCWGQPKTKPELLKMMKEAGFGAIRVPVTWYNHMDVDGNVNAQWMARVKEVVGYVLDQGMYCIINVHHDTGADSYDEKNNLTGYHWIKAEGGNYTSNKAKYKKLWQQIATEFKDYDQELLFESYNEMLDKYSSWCFASYNTSAKYDATAAADAYKAINDYAQSFVDVVRASGGNNAQRNLVVNTYAACCGSGTWNTHLKDPLTQMKIPTDAATGHLMVQVHDYPNIEGCFAGVKAEIDDMVSAWKTNFISKGIPMILGEWGSANVDKGDGKTDYDVRRDVMLQFADYMVKKCKENNVATFYWMGLTDGAFRTQPLFSQSDLAETIVKAYYGNTEGYKFPYADGSSDFICFEGEKAIGWGDGISIVKAAFAVYDKNVKLYLTFKKTSNDNPDIQFNYGDWSGKIAFYVDGTAYNADYNPGGSIGASQTVAITFSETVYNNLRNKGLILQGQNVTITNAVMKSGTADIKAITNTTPTDMNIYNLQGLRVTNPQKGIYIQNGKKYVAK